ncbi:LysR family transcriptional regulator [Gordonia sinesedis]
MLFRQLEYFVALAREQHFARAAAACHVSQPTLSEAIRKLEHEFGVPLVRRGHSFEGLTPQGERLVLWARRILSDHDALQEEVEALRDGVSGELRLGVIPTAASAVAALTDPFCAQNPLVRVSLHTALTSADILSRVREFKLDAGIIYHDAGALEGVGVTRLATEGHVLIVHGSLYPARVGEVDWADVATLPLCLLNREMRGRQLIDRAAAQRGLSISAQLETDSVVTLLAHVGTGRWASIVPQSWTTTLRLPPDIRVLRLQDPVQAEMALVVNALEPASVVTTALVRTVVEGEGHQDGVVPAPPPDLDGEHPPTPG